MKWSDARVAHSDGDIPSAFAPVADAFAANFEAGTELGASFCVVQNGEVLIDLRGGHLDRKKEQPWTEQSIACIYSSGKAVLSLLVAKAVSDGLLEYDAPVATYWPEFASAGKENITVAEAVSHQGGLCGFPDEMAPDLWLDWDAIVHKLEEMAPLWSPGTQNGYHPQTVGFIAGEILKRVNGRSVGDLIAQLAEKLDLSIYCGVPPSALEHATVMQKPPRPPDLGELNEYTQLAFLKRWSAPGRVDRKDWLAAEIPGSNMHSDARSLALIVSPFANDGKLPDGEAYLSKTAIAEALKERIRGDDLVLPFHLSWSAGLMGNINGHFGPNENAFGHGGFGGSCVMIDPQNNLTAAYVMNKMSPSLVGDPRAVKLIDAVYACL